MKTIQAINDVLKPGGTFYVSDWTREKWIHLLNFIIFTLSQKNIYTRSLPEVKAMLQKHDYELHFEKKLSYRFCEFYLIEAKKQIEAPASII